MKEAEALSRIQTLALGSWIVFTKHASDEMLDEMTTEAEVRAALIASTGCQEQTNGRWLVFGGADLEVVLEIQDELIVITVFGRTR